MRNKNTFANGALGAALDALYEAVESCSSEIHGRVVRLCSLFEKNPGMDSVHEMAHAELDVLEREPKLRNAAAALRKALLPRKLPRGAIATEE